MKNAFIGSLLLLNVLFLSACDKTAEVKVEPKIKTEHLYSAQQEALKKAKDLERKMLEATEKKRNLIDELTK